MKLSWADAQTFLAVVEAQSFSAAARQLDLGQPTISRRIKRLEARLDQQLFVRGKHGANITEVAKSLIPAAEQMARWASEFDNAARQTELEFDGTVTVAAPPGIAVEQLAPFARVLKQHQPNIQLQVLAGINHIDLSRGAADFAIRSQIPNDKDLEVLFQSQIEPILVASHEYAKSLSPSYEIADLDWISWSKPYQNVSPRPLLEGLIKDFKPVFTSDDYLVQKAAMRQGLGVMVIGNTPNTQLEAGLVQLESKLVLAKSEFYVVAAKSMRNVSSVNRVIKLFVDKFLIS